MAVMSFAHLKNKKRPEIEKAASSSVTIKPAGKSKTGIMSFAHLKSGKNKSAVKPPETKKPVREPQLSRIPKVMLTANLIKTNYCHGCSRFSPAVGWEKENGNPYGRCLRIIDLEHEFPEVWRIIPGRATVARCYYHLKEKKEKQQ